MEITLTRIAKKDGYTIGRLAIGGQYFCATHGTRIPAGNTADDTEGCILVGWNRLRGRLVNSRSALTLLMNRMVEALARGEKIVIEVM